MGLSISYIYFLVMTLWYVCVISEYTVIIIYSHLQYEHNVSFTCFKIDSSIKLIISMFSGKFN